MGNTKDAQTLDLSVGGDLNICGISVSENIPVVIQSNEDWIGDETFKVFNSPHKNTTTDLSTALTVEPTNAKILYLDLAPETASLAAGGYYYELFSPDKKRILLKGNLTIEL